MGPLIVLHVMGFLGSLVIGVQTFLMWRSGSWGVSEREARSFVWVALLSPVWPLVLAWWGARVLWAMLRLIRTSPEVVE